MADPQDADEDSVPGLTPQDTSADLDEETQDFRFLSALSQAPSSDLPALPRRGAKDFEPHFTSFQTETLLSSRAAMHTALSHPRIQTPKSALLGAYDPSTGDVLVCNPKGVHFRTMGKGQVEGVRLLPEEALYLVGRGSLDLRWGEESGVSMSLQAAYTFLISAEAKGVSLERFTVYAGLKRSGYVVQRGPAWDPDSYVDDGGGHVVKQVDNRPLGLFSRIYKALFEFKTRDPPAQGPLVGVGFYRNYNDVYRLLSIINAHDSPLPSDPRPKPTDLTPQKPPGPPPIRPCFHIWKPNSGFKKTSPGPPDFRLVVVNAREDTFPTLSQLDGLLQSVPDDPPPAGAGLYPKLKHGYRNVILAIVDQGVVSYIRVGDGAFGKEKIFEISEVGGGKRGGGAGRGGRGRGRGRGRGGGG